MQSDLQKTQKVKLKDITEIAEEIGLDREDIEVHGRFKAKINIDVVNKIKQSRNGKVILVTSINPTPFGEGKTTTAIGLSMAINRLGFKSIVTLREPSLGPCLGLKGGATGGGAAQVLPMEDINLHFTGDIHAVTSANNLLCAAIDNHLYHRNELNINPNMITFKRAMDMNDRALRKIIVGLNDTKNAVLREDGFVISAASEVMAILCLSQSIEELKFRLGNILIGYDYDGKPIFAKDLKVHGAMAALLKDAIKPNLVQTSENTPAIIHGGPFANIAHGTNSIIALKIARLLSDYVVVEAGFGADLGAEKFVNIVSRKSGIFPNVAVVVVTTKALKYHGGISKDNLDKENLNALQEGFKNLEKHIQNLKFMGLDVVVALNKYPYDSQAEIEMVKDFCNSIEVEFSISQVYQNGSDGALDLATKAIEMANKKAKVSFVYDDKDAIEQKIRKIATIIYGASDVQFSKNALSDLKLISQMNINHFPVCMAKTQYSLSDDPRLLGRPQDFVLKINELKVNHGAEFIVAISGDIMTMPGLPKIFAAQDIDVDEEGNIIGIF